MNGLDRFGYVNLVVRFVPGLKEVLEEALEFFPGLNLSKYTLDWEKDRNAVSSNNILYLDPFSVRTREEFLFLCFHELRHIDQRENGHLTISEDCEYVIWNGVKYPVEDYEFPPLRAMEDLKHMNFQNYVSSPWEADANGFAYSLVKDVIFYDPAMVEAVKHAKIQY